MTFRYIPLEVHDAARNMALDESCMESVRDGGQPTVRLYRWKQTAISIGYFQCLADEIDSEAVTEDNITIVRRQTGGGAVYHDAQGEITYSIIAPEVQFSNNITASYKQICGCIIGALRAVGIRAEFRPVNDITINQRKVSGNAQTRRYGVLLQHGTILFTVDAKKMFRYLTPDKSKLDDKPFIKSVQSAVTSLDYFKVTREQVEAALQEAFQKAFPGAIGIWTEKELMRADELVASKYGTREWTSMR